MWTQRDASYVRTNCHILRNWNRWITATLLAISNGHRSTPRAMVRLVPIRDATIGRYYLGRHFERFTRLAVMKDNIGALLIILDFLNN